MTEAEVIADKATKIASISDKLKVIDKAFGISVNDYAKIFGIERSTYYNWKKHINPKGYDHVLRIDQLYKIADQVLKVDSPPSRYQKLAKTISYKDRTLMSLLLNEVFDADLIQAHCKHLNALLESRKLSVKLSAHGNPFVSGTKVGNRKEVIKKMRSMRIGK